MGLTKRKLFCTMSHTSIENSSARGVTDPHLPERSTIETYPSEISGLVDRAMKKEVTLGSVQYMAFDSLPGVCESAPFRFCARQIVEHYVELLVLQDELRKKWGPSGIMASSANQTQTSSSGLDALTNVNPFDLQRELNTVNVVAKKIVEHFSDVDERYEQVPRPQGCWRETLEGAFVALALRIKTEITGVQKISRQSVRFLGYDVPPHRSLKEVASSALESINHQLSVISYQKGEQICRRRSKGLRMNRKTRYCWRRPKTLSRRSLVG